MQDLALRFIDLLKSEYADNLNEAVLQSFEKVVGDYQKVPALLIVVDSRDLAIREACPYNFFAGNDIGRKARKDRGRLRLCKRQPSASSCPSGENDTPQIAPEWRPSR